MIKQRIEDPSPLHGVYEGDLKYGRAHRTTVNIKKDYVAERSVETGQPQNLPIFCLPPAFKRDPKLWSRGDTRPPKKVKNDPTLVDAIIQRGMRYDNGLFANVERINGRRQL